MAKNSRTDEYLSLVPSSRSDYIYWSDLNNIDNRFNGMLPNKYPYFFADCGAPTSTKEMIDNKLTLVCLLACLNQEDYDMAMNTITQIRN